MEISRARGGEAAFVGPLDEYETGLMGAWSVARRLLASYSGPLIRVRRSSDDEEMDVMSQADGSLDGVAVLSFCGGASGWVRRVYDQSGLGRDLVQASGSAQRRIVNAGVLVTLGGTAAMEATANNTQGYATSTFSPTYDGTTVSAFCRFCFAASTYDNSRVLGLTKDGVGDFVLPAVSIIQGGGASNLVRGETYGGASPGVLGSAAITTGAQTVVSSICDGATHKMRVGAATGTVNFAEALSVNQVFAAGQYSAGAFTVASGDQWAEGAVYEDNKTSDEAAIREALTPA